MTTAAISSSHALDEKEYRRRIWAWTMYDWANSAFATTILAAVLPVYFSQVAGATLPSATIATAYWSTGLSVSLLIIAIISPILGTISDIMRGKKRFLAIFAGIGIVSTALLVLVSTGDWVLASILGIIGRIGFSGANTFYDALLPHVAREEDRDCGLGARLCHGLSGRRHPAGDQYRDDPVAARHLGSAAFLSERGDLVGGLHHPAAARVFQNRPQPTAILSRARSIVTTSFKRLRETLRDIRRYRELFKYLIVVPHLQRWDRHDHRRGGYLRRRARIWIGGVDPGPAAGAVRRHPIQPDLRRLTRRPFETQRLLPGFRAVQPGSFTPGGYRRIQSAASRNQRCTCCPLPGQRHGCRGGILPSRVRCHPDGRCMGAAGSASQRSGREGRSGAYNDERSRCNPGLCFQRPEGTGHLQPGTGGQ